MILQSCSVLGTKPEELSGSEKVSRSAQPSSGLSSNGANEISIISTTDFGYFGLSFFEQIMPDHPDPIRILISEQDKMDNAIDAINKGRIYKYILNPWTE